MIAVAGGGTNAMDVSKNEGAFFSSRGLRQMFAKY
jgi:hypothetical protein